LRTGSPNFGPPEYVLEQTATNCSVGRRPARPAFGITLTFGSPLEAAPTEVVQKFDQVTGAPPATGTAIA
jgi:hypothetical protein